ncbi:AtpZ/AtpI family protein [Salidesulfovibrio onnuriiensis]|uniref:AtpZ/AtpI family protein n=1 Tax=Salidesulfovibrio onnuriiensis TaxID=2583823 RepID=UPI00202B939C|nr:AtpZ/AtpI family protein [Salidesulfovibrio onnuriiensis]
MMAGPERDFRKAVEAEEKRRLRARKQEHSAWFGLGMFGLVGWAVAIPTVLGVALGVWLDNRFEDSRSWTLSFLGVGILVGCINAWFWVSRESRHHDNHPEDKS